MSQVENDTKHIIRIAKNYVAVIGMKLNLQANRRDWTQGVDDFADGLDYVKVDPLRSAAGKGHGSLQ